MSFKLLDLFEVKFLTSNNLSDRKIINDIKVHSILNINKNIRKQFILYVSTYYKNYTCINVFKKYYNKDKMWTSNIIQYISSFCLSKEISKIYSWEDLENNILVDNNYFLINETNENSILSSDYNFYINLKNHYISFTPEKESELENKLWGKTYHMDEIIWHVVLSNLVASTFGTGINELEFRCKDFTLCSSYNIFYPCYNDKSIIYNKFVKNKLVYCDNCNINLKIENNKLYNNPDFGDLCQYCFKEKKKKEIFRKINIITKLNLVGKKILFQKELENTKKFLKNYLIKKIPNDKKIELYKKITENVILNKKKKNSCSICLEEMEENIYAGSCGHCFHERCYFSLSSNKCPLCRVTCNFKKLYL